MLYTIMKYLRNFFPGEYMEGNVVIKDGTVSLPFESKYVLIEGSKFNDGVHKAPLSDLEDEEFKGTLTAVNPPIEFLTLAIEIENFVAKTEPSAFVSESFGGYSYQKATKENGLVDWQDVFKERLKVFKKI